MEDNSSSSSSSVTDRQPSFLQRTLERLSSTQCLKLQPEDAAPVAVIALQRYLSEQQHEGLDSYCYDVTVTDGVWRAKCVLHPGLNHLVSSNTLRTGGDIHITQCSFVYNERRLGHGYMCVEKLRCDARRSAVLQVLTRDVSSLPMLVKHGMERSVLLQSDVPLQVSRKHYLSLWNNDDPEGDVWSSGCPSADTVLDVSKITLLRSLESSFRNTWTPLPLLVKIIHKSRLRYYGKFGLKIDYPYQAYFEVADQSGTMSLVLWNELCPEFYQRLNVGTVLYLQNYTLKQSYSKRSHPQMDHHRMKTFNSVEICLNPRKPASVITVISPKSVLPQWGLPDVSYQFATRSELENLANNAACDVIGLVTFVGRIERVKSKGNVGPEKYWTYRWIHAVDGTSGHPFILEVFSSSQPEIFNQICPSYHKGQPYVSDPKVKSFIQWTKTLKDNIVLQKTSVGGYYCYPHPPKKYTQSTADASDHSSALHEKAEGHRVSTDRRQRGNRRYFKASLQQQRPLEVNKSTGFLQVPDISTDAQAISDTHRDPTTAKQMSSLTPPSASKRKRRRIQTRRAGRKTTVEGQEEEEETESESEEAPDVGKSPTTSKSRCNQRKLQLHLSVNTLTCYRGKAAVGRSNRQEVSEHLCEGGLYQDSVSRRFTSDERDVLLQLVNLQPTRWSPTQSGDTVPPMVWPGHYQVTILGFLCPLIDAASHSETTHPEPEEVLVTASELEDTHVVCILDLCHLGGDKVEVLINKVYRVTEVCLDLVL
ncbi:hypothetical protein D9C73_017623 [Collichthys lucidus]|uniref:RPA-related protein RADX n=1 Tax=Collichthys lucidus TaxID=240159 RepID=A0A4U5V7Y1_COLLU|nr:hypothetical protein D9C73_017623 [Collichthys lucidus]